MIMELLLLDARRRSFPEHQDGNLATMAASGRSAVSGMIGRDHFGEREREAPADGRR